MITVLLASYNGAAYIREQLDSILQQKALEEISGGAGNGEERHPVIRILISDDGSTDGTVGSLKEYQDRYPKQIILVNRSQKRKEKRRRLS